jgi:NADH:ubiquinone oxidoreductase subunit B-like Fe-S oxidoreductase
MKAGSACCFVPMVQTRSYGSDSERVPVIKDAWSDMAGANTQIRGTVGLNMVASDSYSDFPGF